MQRVLVLGNCGSGKTHLANLIGARLRANVVHLDRLYYQPNWEAPARDEFIARLVASLPGDGRWVADGNYFDTLHVRLPLADTVVLLDMPTALCMTRVLVRTLTTTTRPDMAAGCEEALFRKRYLRFLRYVLRFRRDMLPRVLAKLDEVEHSARVITVRDDGDLAAVLALAR